jgi:hypothetical protein
MRVVPAVCLAVALSAACGGEDDGPVVYPECPNMGEVVIEGELAGQPVDFRGAYTAYIFSNSLGEYRGELSLVLDDEGAQKIEIDFEELLAHGDEVPARGAVTLAADGVVAGNCDDAGLGGRIAQSDDGEVLMFVLRDLNAAPFCGGAEVAGELRGCVRQNDF